MEGGGKCLRDTVIEKLLLNYILNYFRDGNKRRLLYVNKTVRRTNKKKIAMKWFINSWWERNKIIHKTDVAQWRRVKKLIYGDKTRKIESKQIKREEKERRTGREQWNISQANPIWNETKEEDIKVLESLSLYLIMKAVGLLGHAVWRHTHIIMSLMTARPSRLS